MHQKLIQRVVDLHPRETAEWIEALEQVIDEEGPVRAAYLLEQLTDRARASGAELPNLLNTPYVNTIRPEDELPYPWDRALERRIKSLVRWNAAAMVVRANKAEEGIGGHISTFASAPSETRAPGGVPGCARPMLRSGRIRSERSRR